MEQPLDFDQLSLDPNDALEPTEEDLQKMEQLLERDDETANDYPDGLNTMEIYFHEFFKYPLLSREEVVELTTVIQKYSSEYRVRESQLEQFRRRIDRSKLGPTEEEEKTEKALREDMQKIQNIPEFINAVNKMMRSNLRLVISIAKKFIRAIDFEDVVQNGNVGLRKAVLRYKPEKGFAFTTYAVWWIWQSITRNIADTEKTIRIPVHATAEVRYFKNAVWSLAEKGIIRPTVEEIAEEMTLLAQQPHNITTPFARRKKQRQPKTNDKKPVTPEKVKKLLRAALTTQIAELDEYVDEDENTTFGESVQYEEGSRMHIDPLKETMRREVRKIVESDVLTERERLIIKRRFLRRNPHMLREISDTLEVSYEYVRQIQEKALDKLYAAMLDAEQ
ncbi:sigma-70 family RNA polymerase sigma factor [Candidatus Peregrinibacteria bacterium]|nr:sigma-70 family RNA polymerase sigma factor [Candidatus Peregrinibacteria bacterium]